ncbi:Superfamily II helicase [Acanthamoeba polyphaga mimivirus]|nr:DNA or RNA helicase of superfamily II [Acanthamoeba castellanii mamavirus]EJN40836.1 VV A18 helicase [Acanthamoeba polyphaga lentillevirus]UMZ08085.1 Superfamily II helicase [Acanthamoeba polyphaga mimivirus]
MANNIKTKITRFGYIVNKNLIDDETIKEIKSDLTVVPFKINNYAPKYIKNEGFPLYVENGNYIGIPKYYGFDKLGEPDIDKVSNYEYPVQDMTYTGTLRPHQQMVSDKIIKGMEEGGGGVLVMGCGSGKTNVAIYIACKFKLRTLFVVHKTFLRDQVIDRIKSNTNIKKVGIIQRKVVNYKHPFVVSMVQSLAKINYNDEIFKDFGMIIIDEVHHMGARNFSTVYQKISSKYMLGISAEYTRTDGMYKIINWYMGPILHLEEQKPNEMVIVKQFYYSTSNKERIKMKYINGDTNKPNRSKMITNLFYIKRRNRFILYLIQELFDMGKNILFLSGRLKQIDLLYELLNNDEFTHGNVGKYIGGMKESSLKKSAMKQIILGSYDMASEGLDIEGLNVVILGTPKTSIKQSVGRILRKEVYEEHPIVIDIVDVDNDTFKKQSKSRNNYFQKQKYNIQKYYISESLKQKYELWNDKEYIKKVLVEIPEIPDKQTQDMIKTNPNPKKKYQGPINIDELNFLEDD